ncbi:MAG: hypothetical protein ACJZ2K_01585 [Candidatus Poseidoniaceae archaeon]
MRNIICWLIVSILALQVSISGIEMTSDDNSELNQSNEEVTNFAGRQSNGMSGNVTVESDCNLTNWPNSADGLGGPVWQNGSTYTLNSIVEWPANSGHFYQTNMNNTISDISHDDWLGPCTCAEVGEAGGVVWDSTMNYNPWQIVDHNGDWWIAQDAGTMAGDEPVVGSDLWVLCTSEDSTPCDELIGMNTTPWDSTMLVSEGDIYEYPANSSNFYMVAPFINNQTVGEPGVDFDAWDEEYCSCKDIWHDSGQPVWDSSVNYLQNAVVEWPAGSSILYISFDHGTGIEPESADDFMWRLCGEQQPSGNPCEEFDGHGGFAWDSTMTVSAGEVYEYPDESGMFYMVSQGISNQMVGAPGVDLNAWSEKYCTCKEIWDAKGQPVWDANSVYAIGVLLEHPSGSGDIWIAIAPSTTAGVEPGEPWADGNEWELCGPEDNTTGGPCADLDVPVWDNTTAPVVGDIYEYPANSDSFYEIIFIHDDPNGGPGYINFPEETNSDEFWKPYDCPCNETWVANGQPVWDSSVIYSPNSVVEWPAGSMMLYIASPAPGPGDEPGVDPEWELCSSSDEPSGGPCADLDVPVWDNTTAPVVGDIYEYPANSEEYWEIIFDHDGSISEPGSNGAEEFWVPVDCPCKETWVANGQPVWVAGTAYPGNYVVEHPAGSGNLYIPLEPSGVSIGGGEPGVDMHWVLCDGEEPSQGPCDDFDYPVWNLTTVASIGDIYEYPANSDNYYQVTYTDPAGVITTPPGEDQDYEFWTPYSCPCKDTWVANGQPVWDSTITNYAGNYVVEWPAGSGALYLAEGGGLTGSVEPGTDGHWIPCEGNPEAEAEAEDEEEEDDSIPSIGVALTLVGILSAAGFISRSKKQ